MGAVLAGIGRAVTQILGEPADDVVQNRPNFLRRRRNRQHTRADLDAAKPQRAYESENPVADELKSGRSRLVNA